MGKALRLQLGQPFADDGQREGMKVKMPSAAAVEIFSTPDLAAVQQQDDKALCVQTHPRRSRLIAAIKYHHYC